MTGEPPKEQEETKQNRPRRGIRWRIYKRAPNHESKRMKYKLCMKLAEEIERSAAKVVAEMDRPPIELLEYDKFLDDDKYVTGYPWEVQKKPNMINTMGTTEVIIRQHFSRTKTAQDNLLKSRISRKLQFDGATTKIKNKLPTINAERQEKEFLWAIVKADIERKLKHRDYGRILQLIICLLL